MHIIQVAAELAPLAKVGGLADVLLGLSRELANTGHRVEIILPKYDCINFREVDELTIFKQIDSQFQGKIYPSTIWSGKIEGLSVYFIEPHHPRLFFNRGCIYGCKDDRQRFLFFSRAAVDLMQEIDEPDLIHLHDWHTGLIAPLMEDKKTVLTIHNLAYQGRGSYSDVEKIGIGKKQAARFKDDRNPKRLNFLKSAIIYCNAVNTVSPSYAKEILTKAGSKGLYRTLHRHKEKLTGIINGLDYTYWNPMTDPYLPAHYTSREKPESEHDFHTLDRKGYLKKILREKLMLDEQHRPIVGCIARLVPQKGVKFIKHAIKSSVDKGGQFVLLGSSPDPKINKEFHQIRLKYEAHPHIALFLKHQEELAHLIFAGSDMLIVPSIFEPCGLTQLIALRYGTIPIVRKTGGLKDTILDVDEDPENGNGFSFTKKSVAEFDAALGRAMTMWFEEPDRWRHLVVHGMKQDFSWKHPTKSYLALYESVFKDSLVLH